MAMACLVWNTHDEMPPLSPFSPPYTGDAFLPEEPLFLLPPTFTYEDLCIPPPSLPSDQVEHARDSGSSLKRSRTTFEHS